MPDKYGNRTPTKRENEVIKLVVQGLTNREIAVALIPPTTEHVVKNYLRNIYDKLGFDNRLELALWFTHKNFIKEQK
jgi:DNA-binding NarL/FixJ family response regulator